jgi:broad-specificity NMP kinase
MPYIKDDQRWRLYQTPDVLPEAVGELNYIITELCLLWIEQHGKTYTAINDVIGVLECAKLEFYRRLAAPYEDEKIKENGDVY